MVHESIYRPIVKLVSDPFVVIMNNKISLNQIEHTNVSFAHIGATYINLTAISSFVHDTGTWGQHLSFLLKATP
jgi:hypothetical protein